MATKREQKCPDCLYEFMERTDKGSGKCRNCEGAGEASDPMDSFTEAATLGLTKADNICKKCSGTGQCQTCGGTGYVYYYERDYVPTSQTSSSSGGGIQGLLINIFGQEKGILYYRIGFLGIFAAVVYFLFTVAIPLIVINIGIISLLLGVVKKGKSKFLFSLSTLGMLFLILDHNKGWLTKILPANAPSFKGSIPFFFYLNIAAGLIAAYFLIRNYLNEKTPPAENEQEFSKRNLIVMGCLALLGGLTIGGQKYFDAHRAVLMEIPLQSSDSDDYPLGDEGISSDFEQNRVRSNPQKKSYTGKIGKSDAQYELVWNSDGTIDGIYRNPKKPNVTYLLKGKDWGHGKVLLTEFTGDAVSANCELFLQNSCYSGKMNNTDGRVLQMTMCLNQNTNNSLTILSGKFPQATERLLSPNDLSGLSKEDLKIMRNEIFARHGYLFKTPEMKSYFATQSWYHGQYDDVTLMLSEIEKQNVELIKKHE